MAGKRNTIGAADANRVITCISLNLSICRFWAPTSVVANRLLCLSIVKYQTKRVEIKTYEV